MTTRVAQALRLCLVTDAAACAPRNLADVVRAAVRGGVTSVQLREKQLSTRAFVARARLLQEVLSEAPRKVPLIINDRVDVALACAADGVHVGQSDMDAATVRRLLPDAIIGLSVESAADARAVAGEALPVDYLGVSPVFATPTKTDTAQPLRRLSRREPGVRDADQDRHRAAAGARGPRGDPGADVAAAGSDRRHRRGQCRRRAGRRRRRAGRRQRDLRGCRS
jgi:thiamine-phosphate pyrophosphorylase